MPIANVLPAILLCFGERQPYDIENDLKMSCLLLRTHSILRCERMPHHNFTMATSTSRVLFPRLHLAEVEDQPWCPSWLREHSHRSLARMWRTSNSKNGPPAAQAANLLLYVLGGPVKASKYTFIDACAGAGGPTPLLEPVVNSKISASGQSPVEFVLTDLWPDLKAWDQIVRGNKQIRYIAEPIDATKPRKLANPDSKECRIFNLCFHHFDDEAAEKVLASAVQSTDAFMYGISSMRPAGS
jgi:hypothetical protein